MEQRKQPRLEVNQTLTVTILGEGSDSASRPAVVRNASGVGLGLEMAGPVSPGAALKIEFEDSLMLGEVVYTRPLEKSTMVGVRLRETLRGFAELARVCQEYSAEPEEDRARTP
jgi:hypothetical protein